jgi:hypothetical protein
LEGVDDLADSILNFNFCSGSFSVPARGAQGVCAVLFGIYVVFGFIIYTGYTSEDGPETNDSNLRTSMA